MKKLPINHYTFMLFLVMMFSFVADVNYITRITAIVLFVGVPTIIVCDAIERVLTNK